MRGTLIAGTLVIATALSAASCQRSAPVDQPGPAGRLYLMLAEAVPRGLLVMDTPDFDSVYRDNRERTEALLVTVDVLVFVVSWQTYQNAALVDFLRAAVGRGRPYLLVYNEATREEVARGHLDKLAAASRALVAVFNSSMRRFVSSSFVPW